MSRYRICLYAMFTFSVACSTVGTGAIDIVGEKMRYITLKENLSSDEFINSKDIILEFFK